MSWSELLESAAEIARFAGKRANIRRSVGDLPVTYRCAPAPVPETFRSASGSYILETHLSTSPASTTLLTTRLSRSSCSRRNPCDDQGVPEQKTGARIPIIIARDRARESSSPRPGLLLVSTVSLRSFFSLDAYNRIARSLMAELAVVVSR